MERLRRLFEHLAWADEEVLASLEAQANVPVDAVEPMAHVLAAELVWLDRIEASEASVAVWPEADLALCRRLAETSRRRFGRFLDELDETGLARPVPYRNSAGAAFESRVEDILLHVALHGAYHRGQISSSMRRAGLLPAPTDYIAFVRGAPAATRQDGAQPGEVAE